MHHSREHDDDLFHNDDQRAAYLDDQHHRYAGQGRASDVDDLRDDPSADGADEHIHTPFQ